MEKTDRAGAANRKEREKRKKCDDANVWVQEADRPVRSNDNAA